jgi:NAD(P)-dependent dehydrogenase (short-subunit alcohol dehydrogenase family)
MSDFCGQVALVTGASRGIGASVARILAQRGADIVINYRSKSSRALEIANSVRVIVVFLLKDQAKIRLSMQEIWWVQLAH